MIEDSRVVTFFSSFAIIAGPTLSAISRDSSKLILIRINCVAIVNLCSLLEVCCASTILVVVNYFHRLSVVVVQTFFDFFKKK